LIRYTLQKGKLRFGSFFASAFSLATLGIARLIGDLTARRAKHVQALALLEVELGRQLCGGDCDCHGLWPF
jgi:hypothetical protein